jgi:hypothetical protein
LHSIRRKFVDKRLNYKVSYQCRANMALLSAYLDNWQQLILEKVGLSVDYYMKKYFKVCNICCNIYIYFSWYQKKKKRKESIKLQKSTLQKDIKQKARSINKLLTVNLHTRKMKRNQCNVHIVAKFIKTGKV